jgi:hypothetical protein
MRHLSFFQLLGAVLLGAGAGAGGQSNPSPVPAPTLRQIAEFAAGQYNVPIPQVVARDTLPTFDLRQLAPRPGPARPGEYWITGRDSLGRLVEVVHREERLRIGNFTLHLYHQPSYSAWLVKECNFKPGDTTAWEEVNGFFVHLTNANELYYLETVRETWGSISWNGLPLVYPDHLIVVTQSDGELRLGQGCTSEEGRARYCFDIHYADGGHPSYQVYQAKKHLPLPFFSGRSTLPALDSAYQLFRQARPVWRKSVLNDHEKGKGLWAEGLAKEIVHWHRADQPRKKRK